MTTRQNSTGSGAAADSRPEWQHLWFTLQARPWSTLAIIDSAGAHDAESVARALSAVARKDGGTTVDVIRAHGAGFPDLSRLLAEVAEASPLQLRLVACDPPGRNPAMIPILHAVSGAVVVVRLGEASTAALDQTIDVVGRDKIIASVSIG